MGLTEPDLNDDEDYFAVALPDVVIEPTASMSEMIQVRQEQGGSESLAMEIDPAYVSSYGVFDVETASDARVKGRGHGGKPAAEDAPSNLVATGRYLLNRAIFRRPLPHRTRQGWGVATYRRQRFTPL